MNRTPEIRTTKDGSSTLYSNQFDQHYHNPNGAWSESRHVFFDIPGLTLDIRGNRPFNIIETGFGTGLNFIMLADLLKEYSHTAPVHFSSVEAFPITPSQASDLFFGNGITDPTISEILPEIFRELKKGHNVFKPYPDLDLKLHLFYGPFSEWDLKTERAGYFFHDPFSPEANPELWSEGVFGKLMKIADPEAMLATYCAASSARASMAAAGWKVARAQGALGKREMTIASPSPSKLSSWKRVNEDRLIQRLRNGDFS
ncbi:tRNA (5-methylaminomethyl-2-thiouridine)(34)-methyltransferase MnmD [Balneola sp. MJW-20]|uniref:tRNA (5-methylaminomethyl-2-thiouridine)(34)-methyltransferase MnmD n=1 Tax=Gracilimonas aurantiaca TaxID=3234185 RepID=UPI003466C6E3